MFKTQEQAKGFQTRYKKYNSKRIIDKLCLIKKKTFARDPVKRMKRQIKWVKRQITDWEEMFLSHIPRRDLKSAKLSKANIKVNSLLRKWQKTIYSHFTSEDIQMANKQEKRYSTASLVNRAMKSKATMRYPYTSIRKTKIKK